MLKEGVKRVTWGVPHGCALIPLRRAECVDSPCTLCSLRGLVEIQLYGFIVELREGGGYSNALVCACLPV